ncbi:hypothetical protein EMIT0P260_120052 [Pseudomonas sp. IT-P260]
MMGDRARRKPVVLARVSAVISQKIKVDIFTLRHDRWSQRLACGAIWALLKGISRGAHRLRWP